MDNAKTPTAWDDAVLIREVKAGGRRRNTAWEYIYKAWRAYYLSPVLKAGGTPDQADEVLGRVVVDVERQMLKDDFSLFATSLKTYFTECLRRAWVRAQEKEEDWAELDPKLYASGQHSSVEQDYIRKEQLQRAKVLLNQLGERCKTLLLMFARGYSMREIAEELGFQNEQSAKNEKGNCQRKLIALAGNNQ